MRFFSLLKKQIPCRFAHWAVLIIILFLAGFSGCAYPISQDWRNLADSHLTLAKFLDHPNSYPEAIVIWGGVIARVRSHSEETEMTVIESPLDSRGCPDTRITQGRFLAETERHLNPRVYREGMKVTLAGQILGVTEIESGPMKVPYPVLRVRELHLWPEDWKRYFPLTWGKWEFGEGEEDPIPAPGLFLGGEAP
jgi:outer membrane lipoprotein